MNINAQQSVAVWLKVYKTEFRALCYSQFVCCIGRCLFSLLAWSCVCCVFVFVVCVLCLFCLFCFGFVFVFVAVLLVLLCLFVCVLLLYVLC